MVFHGVYTRQWKEAIFQIAGALFVAYEDEDMREKAEKVLDHIIGGGTGTNGSFSKQREGNKKVRSLSNLAKKSD